MHPVLHYLLIAGGSPVHVHPHPVRFSISHSCHLTAAAVLPVGSMHNKLGIDLEQRIPGRDVDAIAEAWFHPLECRLLDKAANNEQRLRLFYKMWTAKEAWVKARRLSVWKVGGIPTLEIVRDGGSGLWLELPGNYTLAIHVSGEAAVEDVRIHPGFECPGLVNTGISMLEALLQQLYRRPDLNRYSRWPADFKSAVSTNSTTPACFYSWKPLKYSL